MATSEYEIFNTSTSSGVAGMRPLDAILRHPRTDAEEVVADDHVRRERDKINRGWPDWMRELRAVGSCSRSWSVPVYHVDEWLFDDN